MRRSLPLLLLFIAISISESHAQRGHSYSIGVGGSYYYGDLSDDFSNIFLHPAGYIAYGYYLNPGLSVRAGLVLGSLSAADSLSSNFGRRVRNLHFRSPIAEVSALLYYEFLPDKKFGVYWRNKPTLSPYVFGGVAIFGFNPRARYQQEWVALQPLGTEGQFVPGGGYPKPYSLLQVSLPAGGGLNYRFASNVSVSLEIGYRKTFTDYLDDVSTTYVDGKQLLDAKGPVAVALADPSGGLAYGSPRGNPGSKDGYLFGLLALNFYLDKHGNK